MTVLAIETSCDDTCAAVVTDDGEIRRRADHSETAALRGEARPRADELGAGIRVARQHRHR